MKIDEFQKALKEDDFSVGDSFWIDDWELEVVNGRNYPLAEYQPVFKWELTRQDCIELMKKWHSEIKNPDEFFDRHKDEIIDCFTKGFDVLVGECGATYETVMEDAIKKVANPGKDNFSSEEKKQNALDEHDTDDEGDKSTRDAGRDFLSQQEHKQPFLDYYNFPTKPSKNVKNSKPILVSKSYGRYVSTLKNTVPYKQKKQLLSGYERNDQPLVRASFYKPLIKQMPRLYQKFQRMPGKNQYPSHKIALVNLYGKQAGGSLDWGMRVYKSLESYLS